jgi:hypothetical protein
MYIDKGQPSVLSDIYSESKSDPVESILPRTVFYESLSKLFMQLLAAIKIGASDCLHRAVKSQKL